MAKSPLVNGGHMTEMLVERYGPEAVWQVERLGEHTFRAWLNDGRVAVALISGDGEFQVYEMEGIC